ncbi:MAG: polyprenol monophosphomannose synthase [Bacteriovorax sp.]|jgi:dolichol-phosphate mannosyltransferase
MLLPFNETLIIIPTYNEIDNVEKIVRTLFVLYPNISILIIEDGSPDGTTEAVRGLMKNYTNLSIIERKSKLGLGTAYITGFKWALERSYQYIFEMDCDFSHDPLQITDLLKEAIQNDLVIGSRYKDGMRIVNWPLRRLILSYMASLYTRLITGIPVYDTTSGFKCFKRSALESLNFEKIISNGYAFQLEINYKIWAKGLKIVEVPIIFYERRDGQSKMESIIIFEAMIAVFRLRLQKMLGIL